MRRRDLLTKAASGAAAAMITANGHGGPGLSDLVPLSGPAPHDSPTLAGLEKRIAFAHAIYQRGEYQHVADGLPALIGCTTNGTVLAEDERSRRRVLAAQGWHSGFSWTAIQDALDALPRDRSVTSREQPTSA